LEQLSEALVQEFYGCSIADLLKRYEQQQHSSDYAPLIEQQTQPPQSPIPDPYGWFEATETMECWTPSTPTPQHEDTLTRQQHSLSSLFGQQCHAWTALGNSWSTCSSPGIDNNYYCGYDVNAWMETL
jgi:hypothetical protein